MFNLHSYVVRATEHQAVIAATDDDAAWNVAKTLKTRWWKDNGWVLYGPAYFRLNHTIQYFWQRTAQSAPLTENEIWESTAHHAVMTTSLLSVAGIALLLASSLVNLWWMRFLLAMALNSALLTSATWSEFVLRAHPDHLFTFVIVAALWCLFLAFARPEEPVWRLLSAILFGISVSVKMTLTLCVPGFVLLFVPPLRRENWRSGLNYLGVMLLAYFVIGFPQTIVLDRPFRELGTINGLSAPPTLFSAVHWLQVYIVQIEWPLLVFFLGWLCFERRRWHLPRVGWLRLYSFVLLPFVVLLGKNMMVPADHYVMPFAGMLLLMIGFALASSRFLATPRWPLVRGLIFFTLFLAIWGATPTTLQAQLDKSLRCREQTRETYGRLLELYNAGANIWVDPYVPYKTDADKSRVEMSWEKTWDGYARGHWTVMALNRDFRQKFSSGSEPDPYTQTDVPGWRPVREFYMAFKEGDEAVTPKGDHFRRVYQNSCGQEIWLKN